MKYLLVFVLSFIIVQSKGQARLAAFEAIGKGDVNALSVHFDEHIELCFNSKIEILDKTGATRALKAFFERNPPKSCSAIHNGSSKDKDSVYSIGILHTLAGKVYRVYLYIEETAGKPLIKEIRIDKES